MKSKQEDFRYIDENRYLFIRGGIFVLMGIILGLSRSDFKLELLMIFLLQFLLEIIFMRLYGIKSGGRR